MTKEVLLMISDLMVPLLSAQLETIETNLASQIRQIDASQTTQERKIMQRQALLQRSIKEIQNILNNLSFWIEISKTMVAEQKNRAN